MDWVLIYYLCLLIFLLGIPLCKAIIRCIRIDKGTDEQDSVSMNNQDDADEENVTISDANNNEWVFCAVGNIKKQHLGPNGEVFYGTKAFAGGTKVYIYDRSWGFNDGKITVLGLNRFSRYEDESIPVELIENVRLQRIFKPGVLKAMDSLPLDGYWWRGKTAQDKRELKAFVEMWNNCAMIMYGKSEAQTMEQKKEMGKLTKENLKIEIEPCNVGSEMANITIWINEEKKILLGIDETAMTLNDIIYLIGALFPFNKDFELELDYYLKNSEHTNFYERRDGTYSFEKAENSNEIDSVSRLYHEVKLEWMYSGKLITCLIKRPINLDENPDVIVDMCIPEGSKINRYESIISYKDLCYCVAKALDTTFRKNGIRGFQQMMGRGNIELSYFLYLKAMALDKMDMIEEYDIEGNTHFENEMALLMMHMN